MAAPKGNQNARKGKEWHDALRKSLCRAVSSKDKRKKLDAIADKVVDQAMEGSSAAWQEIGNRMDGKPITPVTGVEDGAPIAISIIRYGTDTDSE